jgi:MFS superfamily sulfate permease-like transporter
MTDFVNGTVIEGVNTTVATNSTNESAQPSLFIQALQYNMLLTSSVIIGIMISFLWCICHFVVKWCHSRSLNQYRSQQESSTRFFNSLGIPMSQHPHLSPAQRNQAMQQELAEAMKMHEKASKINEEFNSKNNGNIVRNYNTENTGDFNNSSQNPEANASLLHSNNTNNSNSNNSHNNTPSRSVQRKQTYDEMYARMSANCKGPGAIMTA